MQGYFQRPTNPTVKHELTNTELFKLFFENNLMFKVSIDNDQFKPLVKAIGEYNEFNPDRVIRVLLPLIKTDEDIKISIGREFSPVIYLEKYIEKDTNLEEEKQKFDKIGKRLLADEISIDNVQDIKIKVRYWFD